MGPEHVDKLLIILRRIMFEYYVKKVTKVVDGDTIDVDIDLGFDISFSSRVRLAELIHQNQERRTRWRRP
jgi:micrococcal nuclease